MPELPEVEWMVNRLKPWCQHRRIQKVEVTRGKYLPDDQPNEITDQTINDVTRRGKFIIFHLERGKLVSHNAMSGYWDSVEDPGCFDYVEGKRQPTEADVRVRISLRGATLRYHDSRLFGSLTYYEGHNDPPCIAELGPEAIGTPHGHTSTWNLFDLINASASKRPIKKILMDQEEVAGVGNIYAAEALWLAQINPLRPGNKLNSEEVTRVYNSTQAILKTAQSFNLDYTKYLRCYRQKECTACSKDISNFILGGRSTYWCSTCQK